MLILTKNLNSHFFRLEVMLSDEVAGLSACIYVTMPLKSKRTYIRAGGGTNRTCILKAVRMTQLSTPNEIKTKDSAHSQVK